MLPAPLVQQSVIQFVDDPDNFSALAETCPGPDGKPCIYDTTNYVSASIMILGVVLLIATLSAIFLHKKNQTKRAAEILAVPTTIAFIPISIIMTVAIVITAADAIRGAKSGSLSDYGFTAVFGFYFCLAGYALRNILKVYKGLDNQAFKKTAIASAILAVLLLFLPWLTYALLDSMDVEATK